MQGKQYYKIGEVAKLVHVNCSVLRFWETEFDVLAPLKTSTGQRRYTQKDLEIALTIRRLLYEEKLTIAGARSKIIFVLGCKEKIDPLAKSVFDESAVLRDIYRDLCCLRDLLN